MSVILILILVSVYQAEGIALHGANLDSTFGHLEDIAEPDTAPVKELQREVKELQREVEGYEQAFDFEQDKVAPARTFTS